MKILAIDPGNEMSAYCILEDYKPIEFGKLPNVDMLQKIFGLAVGAGPIIDKVAIEMVASYGMPVGKEVFDTCVWVGRFWEMYGDTDEVSLIYRLEVKEMICHDSRAKDANIRQALIDRFAQHDFKNGKGTKKKPDWFYGFAADVWAAYAVGVTWLDKQKEDVKHAT